jgi:hypothetical protein
MRRRILFYNFFICLSWVIVLLLSSIFFSIIKAKASDLSLDRTSQDSLLFNLKPSPFDPKSCPSLKTLLKKQKVFSLFNQSSPNYIVNRNHNNVVIETTLKNVPLLLRRFEIQKFNFYILLLIQKRIILLIQLLYTC